MSTSLRYTYLFLSIVLTGALIIASGCLSEREIESADMDSVSELASLTYYTEQLPPYNYQENGTIQGISVDLLEAITDKMGNKVYREEINLVSWTEGYQAALTRNNTVLFSMARTPDREELFKWAGPIYTNRKVLFARPDRGITIEGPEDLNGYLIGVITDDIAIQYLLDIGVDQSQIVTENNVSTLIALLDNSEIDLWAYPENSGRYFAEQATGNYNSYMVVYQLHTQDTYYAFSKDVPDSVVQSFQQALDAVRDQKDEHGISDYEQIVYQNIGVSCARQTFMDEAVIALVDTTATAIEKNATDTFQRINAGEASYRDLENPALYTFVYDVNVTMVAHADNILLVGTNFKGKTDVTGKPFRDEIVSGALKNGTGWVEYVYTNPVHANLYYKTTYYRLARGSDGNSYIVCSGNFKSCDI
ncbi:transporter substrate-binding domain-containing protein [Methanolobus psychrotolerans]|uniref:transporter substrate-binding domain-containing protein n=1 Tax=Methanolobus psychrotolerans TaxID=1874706 RepID=UPI000B91A3F7|nr:transporter substrate-binding domain-containing protein [Methanolobus psychrotolerans]